MRYRREVAISARRQLDARQVPPPWAAAALSLLGAVALLACEPATHGHYDDGSSPAGFPEASGAEAGSGEDAALGPAPDTDAAADAAAPMDAEADDADLDGARIDATAPTFPTRTSLVLPELWTALEPLHDPFEDRPAFLNCSPAAVMPETLSGERVLSVDTGGCTYLTALQPTRREVSAGETLKVRLWHFELSAPEQAEAHAAVLVDGLRVLDERVAIPQPGGLIVGQLRAERKIAAGAPVHFHLHNHGANSWALIEVSAGP